MASPSLVIVIGAGWTGLAAAKTYLQINPDVSLTIIDEDGSVGGVWSDSRVYPGLVADSCAAIFDYSDFPMDVELDLDKWADLPAEKVHQYLEHYTDKFDLRKRCKLNTRVVKV
jgi:cation diffusion facilitator CzcD-associated flavoprotein CzcO